MALSTGESQDLQQNQGFHPDGGWSHTAEGPRIRVNAALRSAPLPADCRTLQETPEFAWSSDAVKALLAAIEIHRAAHGGLVDQTHRDSEKLRSQNLASAKLPSPLKKLQDRLRIANACLAYHEALLPYLQAVLQEAETRHQECMREYSPLRAKIDQGLIELGFAPHLDPRIYTRNRLLIEVRNRAAFAGSEVDGILEARRRCRDRIEAAHGEVAFVEGEIRSAIS